MKNKRWLDLLTNLNTGEPVSSEYLGCQLQLSSRTVRSELKELRETLENEGAHLISKPKLGYFLVIEDEGKYRQFLNSLDKNKSVPVTSNERVQYLLEALLVNNREYVKLDDLCSQLYVSKSTLTENLREVRELLREYGLKLITRPGYGIRLEGNEFSLRLCLAACSIGSIDKNDKDNQKILQAIAQCIMKGMDGTDLKISEVSYQNLIVHIYIALKRIEEGNRILLDEEQLAQISQEKEFGCAERITQLLEEKFACPISKTETGYIAIHLASKRIIECTHNQENLVINDEIYNVVHLMLKSVYETYNVDFHNDLELIMILAAHLVPFSKRMQYNMKLKNPLLKEIKSHYMMAYMMAVTACEVLEAHYHQHIQEDEIGYFALSLNLALERKKTGISKKNILVVCATGRGSAQLLMYQLKREFGKYLNSAETCDVMELKDFDLTLIDYVITTVSIPFSISRPILEISLFLNYKDENRIQTLLTGKADRTLEGYFQPELFMSELEAGSKQEILEAMVERIHRVRKVPENFLEAVLERERMGITSFGNMVAIPHPNYPLTDETFVCVAILKNPMYWDKQKVQVVFMLSMGKNGTEDVQYFSSILSRMLFSTEYISEMIKKPEYSGMLQRLEKIEREMKENNG